MGQLLVLRPDLDADRGAPYTSGVSSELENALPRFKEALDALWGAAGPWPGMRETLASQDGAWADLLTYKLVPHLASGSCLIVAVAGGTNTGKSTVFNLLLGFAASPVRATAAATRQVLVAASPKRTHDCLEGRLFHGFPTQPLLEAGDLLTTRTNAAVHVLETDSLDDGLMLADTPDVDSIEVTNWEHADHVAAAADVLVAVLTGEKYRDARVVDFFRRAAEAGRTVLPLMNKADPADDYAVAREQLAKFVEDTDLEAPCFVLSHDFRIAEAEDRPIASLDGEADLRAYLGGLDVAAVKKRVYARSIAAFAEGAGAFIERAEALGARFGGVQQELLAWAGESAQQFEPAPGPEVGGLFHEYVQKRRNTVSRWIGNAGRGTARGINTVSRALRKAVFRKQELEAPPEKVTEQELRRVHGEAVEGIARNLLRRLVESARHFEEPLGTLLQTGVASVGAETAIARVVAEALGGSEVSAAFREHAWRTLDAWWDGHRGQRRAVEALDALLAVTPAAIAVPVAILTGPGLPEATVAIAGPFVEQFAARVFEYQFGDAMFDFLNPWRAEQRARLAAALETHLIWPALAPVAAAQAAIGGEALDQLKETLAVISVAGKCEA